MSEDVKILERVQALLDKAENTTFEEEAKAFFAKAQELLSKYALSEFDLKNLNAARINDTTETVGVLISEPNPSAKRALINAIARANGVMVVNGTRKRHRTDNNVAPFDTYTNAPFRIVSSDASHKHFQTVWLSGFSKDIEATLLLYTSMLIQIKSEIKRAEIPAHVNKHTWSSHFIIAFASEIGTRLNKAARETEQTIVKEAADNGSDLLPILVTRKQRVKETYEATWKGNTKSSSASYARTSTTGFAAGRAAGARADIGNKRIGGIGALGTGR
jgi:hypothetical protein